MNKGRPPKFLEFYGPPHKVRFIAFLLTNFRKFSKFGVLCPAIFFEKFPKISKRFPEIFSTFSKSKKTIIIVTKLVQNDYVDQNLAKFSNKTKKRPFFPKNYQFFKTFVAFDAENLEYDVPKTRFFRVRVSPLGLGPPNLSLIVI